MRLLGHLPSGIPVYDRHKSHLHESVEALLPEVFARVDSRHRLFFIEEVVFDQIVGETICVETTDDDEIVYAQRPNRKGLTRFVKNRTPEPCDTVTAIFKANEYEGHYVLITAFIGYKPEPEPWDERADENAIVFWRNHALVWGSEPIVSGTETSHPST